MVHNRKISLIGLGYVGLPVAIPMARHGVVIGFDHDPRRIAALKAGNDATGEIDPDDMRTPNLRLSADPDCLRDADFHIVTVPTPIDDANTPDLGPILEAAQAVGERLKKGDIVVFESTVYPGLTEEECVPVMERASELKFGSEMDGLNRLYKPVVGSTNAQ